MVDKPKSSNDSFNSENDGDEAESGGIKVSETLKRIIATGIGAAFMTEESIRNYLSEVKLPKDALNYILQGASKSKEELLERVGNEVVRIISKIDFVSEASKFVEEHKFKISAEVEVVKKSDGSHEFKVSKEDKR